MSHSLVFCCFQQVSDIHSHWLSCLHLDLSEIKSFSCLSSLLSIMSCNNSILFPTPNSLGQHFPMNKSVSIRLLKVFFHSIMSWSKLSYLRTCQGHLCFLCQIIFNMLLASLACTNTSLFVTFLSHLIFSIFHHVHISNASNSFLLALANVQVSAAYSATFQTVLFIIHFFCSQFDFPVNNFFLSVNSVLTIAFLARMSLVAMVSSLHVLYAPWLADLYFW